ncbi:MAG TPA: DHA2 family efflux MFS transporter permease subunit [Ktedonobacterales bacterium]|nr:DHA2 family efflux MFS transporter permease subunit [Ktedonobacterales bacterium]
MRLDYKWQVAIVGAIGLFMAILDNTIVSVALPQMLTFFHTNEETITWVATAYFLAQAAIIPVTGYLSDRIGGKWVFLGALTIFTIGSALCAFAPTKEWLIAFRVFQGLGGGALFPVVFALIYRVFPPAERGPASAIIGVPVLLAPAFGPTIGGYLTTTFDWRAIFTINIPVGIIALTLGSLILQGRTAERTQIEGGATGQPAPRGSFDILGLLLSMSGFTALVYGITEAGSNGWSNATADRFLLLGGALVIAFVIVELIVRDPVIDVRLFLNYTFTISNVLMWGLAGFLFGSLFLLPFFFENVQGHTPLTAGEILISQGLAAAVATVISGALYNRVGPRILAVIGFILVTAGTYGLTQLHVGTTGQSLQGWLILRGLGLGFTNIPLQTLALSAISNKAMARASSLVNVTRQVFSAVGVSALTAYLTQQATTHGNEIKSALLTALQTHTLPAAGAARDCVVQFGRNAPAIQACAAQHAITHGLDDTFWVAMIGCAICAVLALIVGRDPAVQAAKRAKERGEAAPERQPALVGE